MENNFGFVDFLSNLDIVGYIIVSILVIMSLSTWYVIILKALMNISGKKKSEDFLNHFWRSSSVAKISELLSLAANDEPFARVAHYTLESAKHFEIQDKKSDAYNDFLTRSIRYACDEERAKLETGMTLLASVASTAPFIGLFGTVLGIYHALIAIGISGQGTLDKVAGPVGEALIMTAFGLVVAIPAVLGYNSFNRLNKKTLYRLDGFAYSMYSYLTTGGHPKRTVA